MIFYTYLYTIDDTVYGTTGNELNKNYVSINIGYFPSLENSKMFNSQMHAWLGVELAIFAAHNSKILLFPYHFNDFLPRYLPVATHIICNYTITFIKFWSHCHCNESTFLLKYIQFMMPFSRKPKQRITLLAITCFNLNSREITLLILTDWETWNIHIFGKVFSIRLGTI